MSARTVFILLATCAAAPATTTLAAETIAIVSARIHTMSKLGVIERGTVLIEDGRIAAVGVDVAAPPSATVIEANGRWVTPGLFNAYTHLGLVENEDVRSTMDHGAPDAPMAAGFDVYYGVNSDSTLMPIARLRGVTRAAVFPLATHSIFGGMGALLKLDGEEDVVFKRRASGIVELGAQGASIAGGARGAAWLTLFDAFGDAQRTIEHSSHKPLIDIDFDEAALAELLAGDAPLIVHVERTADILQVLELKKRYSQLRPVLLGANEAWRVAPRIAAAGVPVILDSLANLPTDFEMMAATQESAARLVAAGVLIAIAPLYRYHAAVPHNAGLVTQYAGNAVTHGLPWDAALRAITINPAIIFGVSDQLGSIERGKLADIVVWSGDPLELNGRPEEVLIAGERLPMVSRQTKLRERYRNLKGGKPFAYRR